MMKSVQFIRQRMHLVILLQRNFFGTFVVIFGKNLQDPATLTFDMGLCVVPLRRISCERMKSVQLLRQRLHLAILPQRNLVFLGHLLLFLEKTRKTQPS